ncbi:pilus assembly FimT family protein [Thermodesulfovibrio thiophilus]|uniref:pilus assembly FimT family protein n=1 Tax=Thermodesulfovibrio thiophilus TaxID=340095 RepID=UPI00185C0FA6|nr:prepilin-type N-terminal cleavage/methylation domain-containing protein [Thermodesulfovibrio thiophilus]HHW20914.1 prepilin-type N-terminal cleavage/methylation domain-containing protein [Thermodesulfovibrio thiophilus]
MDRKVAGFSILELLITIAILSILMYVGVSEYTKYKAGRELMRQTNMLADELGWIKSQSIAKQPHGIVVNVNNYTIFIDNNGNCTFDNDTIVEAKSFISGISSTKTVIGVFDRRGYPLDNNCGLGMDGITLTNNLGSQKIINISKYGRIKIE